MVALLIFFTKMPEVEQTGTPNKTSIAKAWSHGHLKWGVIAQFFYVGAQVCVTSLFIPFAKFTNDMPEKTAAWWLGIALLGFMIGRFVGTYLTRFIAPHKLLTVYASSCILLLTLAVFVKSGIAMWAVFSVPFFESIMFPTIFALAIKDLKEDTEIGSSLVVMAVAGGGLFPLAMGLLSDQFNLQVGYIVPLLCFIVVAWYGLRGYKITKA
jgi:FHS family L-fucose permease-like MFS transporter